MIRKIIVLCCLINSNSMKFHSEGCRAEQKIRADHRVYLETREEAINAGYTPCGICKP